MKPQHFHLGAALVLALAAVFLALSGHLAAGGFISLGALVALVWSKAAKSRILD